MNISKEFFFFLYINLSQKKFKFQFLFLHYEKAFTKKEKFGLNYITQKKNLLIKKQGFLFIRLIVNCIRCTFGISDRLGDFVLSCQMWLMSRSRNHTPRESLVLPMAHIVHVWQVPILFFTNELQYGINMINVSKELTIHIHNTLVSSG
jgi:hypothetical protein